MKKIKLVIFFSFLFLPFLQAEDITLTTYYPSPSGVYEVLNTSYLQAGSDSARYDFIRLSKGQSAGAADAAGNYFAGLMWNKNDAAYGDGDDFTLYTYGNRDIYIRAGGGKVSLKGAYSRVENASGNPAIMKVRDVWYCTSY
ncbi:MAG: hypothetical protein K9M00_05090 [Candidatus Omnitrophica bacterium]|nr:hypothetical protein [Candidatus Omnitrophota bacterium]